MKKRNMTFLLLLVFACLAHASENFPDRFEQVHFLDTKGFVLSLLGKPSLISSYNVLGIKHELMSWRVGNGEYAITFVADHVYGLKERVSDVSGEARDSFSK